MDNDHPLEIYLSYSHRDEKLRDRLERHLMSLVGQGEVRIWHDRQIQAGENWNDQIAQHIGSADLILPLLSPDFIASDFCRDVEMPRTMELHWTGESVVIPIILRPCDWQWMPFGGLQVLPTGGTPITRWPDVDEAFVDVIRGIQDAIKSLRLGASIPDSARKLSDQHALGTMSSEAPHDVFISYAHRDEELHDEFAKHLAALKQQGLIRSWDDRKIQAGEEWAGEIDPKLESADLILSLVSADFLASDYCRDRELSRALERHRTGEAVVLPIILRPCLWQLSPLSELRALPKSGQPITSWEDRDEAFLEVIRGIREVIEASSLQHPVPIPASQQPRRRIHVRKASEGPYNVFISYAIEDEPLRHELAKHLAALESTGVIRSFHDRRIAPEDDWRDEIAEEIESADLFLLLVSADYIASDYLREVGMLRALDRHTSGEAVVLPILLRPCDWPGWLPGEFPILPKDNRPITRWEDRDEAFLDVIRGIREVIEELSQPQNLTDSRRDGFQIQGLSPTIALESLAELGSDLEVLGASGTRGRIRASGLGSEALLFVPAVTTHLPPRRL